MAAENSPYYNGQIAINLANTLGSGVLPQAISAIQTGNYTALISDDIILVSGTFLPLIVSLPSVGVQAGKVFTVKEISSIGIKSNITSGTLLITGISSVNFDGTLTGFVPVGNLDKTGISGTFGPLSRKTWIYDGTQYWNIM